MMKIFIGTVALVALFLSSVFVASAADLPPRIEVNEVNARMESGQAVIFIDTRNGSAWSNSTKIIPEAIRVRGAQEFAEAMKTLQKDDFIVTYCT